jgi:universal stress protein A
MKLKATPRARKVVVELESPEENLPPIALSELRLKKILVPIDFSAQSRKAFHYAISFAKQFNAEILLLHVVEMVPAPDVLESGSFNIQLRDAAADGLAEWKKQSSRQAPVQTELRDGSPFREIVRVADESNIDLIILGTQGRSGLSHFLIGSTAERVVRHAPCPVMVVREREHDFLEPEQDAKSNRRKVSG